MQVDGNGRLLRQQAVLRRRVIVVSAEIAPSRWVTTAAPLPPLNAGVFGWLIFQTFVLYGFVLITVLWVGGRLARPLAELRQAAERFDRRSDAEPIVERGPSDIRRLIAAFNSMRTRITGMLDEKDRMLAPSAMICARRSPQCGCGPSWSMTKASARGWRRRSTT